MALVACCRSMMRATLIASSIGGSSKIVKFSCYKPQKRLFILSKDIGDQAEQAACNYLTQQGLVVVEKNFYSRSGEIDLIMLDGEALVFVEVRYRKTARFGSALESVTTTKQQRLINTAQYFLQTNTISYSQCRFDVVAISTEQNDDNITWVKSAFQL